MEHQNRQPQWARETLSYMRENGDSTSPEALLEYVAENPHLALYKRFNWDDTEAGHLYRVDQARQYLREIKVTYTGVDAPGPRRVRVIHSIRSERGTENAYRTIGNIARAPSRLAALVAEAWREALSWKRRHEFLQHHARGLAGLIRSIQRAEDAGEFDEDVSDEDEENGETVA